MTHRVFKTVQLGLVIVAAAALVACPDAAHGDLGRPTPAWSPPTWLHGTWKTASSDLGSGTLKASRHNVEVDLQISGITHSYDFAKLDEDGVVSIDYQAGVDAHSGQRYYLIAADAADGTSFGFTFYRVSADEVEGYMKTWLYNVEQTSAGPFYLTKQ